MNESEIKAKERERCARLVEKANLYLSSAYTGYTEKLDLIEQAKRKLAQMIRISE